MSLDFDGREGYPWDEGRGIGIKKVDSSGDGVVDRGEDSDVVELSVVSAGVGGGLGSAVGHLREETRAWAEELHAEFKFVSHQLKILVMAGETWDRYLEAREVIAEKGMTYEDRFEQPRARPEVAIERDCRIGFARLMRDLYLEVEDDPDEGRFWGKK